MKGLIAVLVLSSLAVAQSNFTAQQLNDGLASADRVQAKNGSDDDMYQALYATAFIQGVAAGLQIGHQICPTQFVSGAATAQIVKNFLLAHPERWHQTAAVLAADALKAVYPCKDAK